MSIALVTITKALAGQVWENTHVIGLGGDLTSTPSDADLTTWGAASSITSGTTSGGAGVNLIQRIVNFERLLHTTYVTVTGVYLTDGKRNRLGNTEYWTTLTSLPCLLAGPAAQSSLAPGSISCVVNRNPAGFSHRPGRLFVRGMLADSDVVFSTNRLVDFTDATTRSAVAANVAAAVSGSGITTHLSGGSNIANGSYCIGHYHHTKVPPPPPNLEGQLESASVVASIGLGLVTTRQGTRGRRRSV